MGPRLAPPPPPPAGPEGGGGRPRGQARLAPPLPGPGAGARGEQRELLCPARARSRPARPSSSGARSRRAFRVSRCSCGNCRLFIPSGGKGGKVGRRPGPVKERGREASPVGLARGEAPGSWPSSPRGFYSK